MTDMREIVRRQEIEARRQAVLDSIPAVAPDNDPEDTIARFDGLNVTMPPYAGYQARNWGDEHPGFGIDTPDDSADYLPNALFFALGLILGFVGSVVFF